MKRPGLTISCIAHACALALAVIALSAQPMEAPATASMPVSFISANDFSKLAQGVKNAPQLKVDDPKPFADKADTAKPVDQLAPKVADKPEITTDSSKQKQQPKPDPKPDNKPETKIDVKPETKPDTKPDTVKPDTAKPEKAEKPKPPEYKPDQIANLLKKDEAKNPSKPDNSSKFDADQVAQLLDKRTPQRQVAAAETPNNNATLGAAVGAAAAQMSQSEIDALRARISSCWSPPPGIDVNSRLYVVLRVLFKQDGSLMNEPVLVEGTASQLGPALAESAKRALLLCQPFTMLKPEHYDQWRDLELKFDPHELLGG
jgi:hypothetical protein